MISSTRIRCCQDAGAGCWPSPRRPRSVRSSRPRPRRGWPPRRRRPGRRDSRPAQRVLQSVAVTWAPDGTFTGDRGHDRLHAPRDPTTRRSTTKVVLPAGRRRRPAGARAHGVPHRGRRRHRPVRALRLHRPGRDRPDGPEPHHDAQDPAVRRGRHLALPGGAGRRPADRGRLHGPRRHRRLRGRHPRRGKTTPRPPTACSARPRRHHAGPVGHDPRAAADRPQRDADAGGRRQGLPARRPSTSASSPAWSPTRRSAPSSTPPSSPATPRSEAAGPHDRAWSARSTPSSPAPAETISKVRTTLDASAETLGTKTVWRPRSPARPASPPRCGASTAR